jgi:2-polyprenyl-3-methyl-5-hydroxy-6-metoxy-1,4-benzoquinol methylase
VSNLLSEEYREQLEQIHSSTKWGATARGKWKQIVKIAESIEEINILDYGAGQGGFKKKLQEEIPNTYNVIEYEPGRKELSASPEPQNYVICIDVLEHVEPELVDNVLDDLKRVTLKRGFFTVSTRLAHRKLPDGRNAHLTVEPIEWWKDKINKRFNILKFAPYENGGEFIVEAKDEEL